MSQEEKKTDATPSEEKPAFTAERLRLRGWRVSEPRGEDFIIPVGRPPKKP